MCITDIYTIVTTNCHMHQVHVSLDTNTYWPETISIMNNNTGPEYISNNGQ